MEGFRKLEEICVEARRKIINIAYKNKVRVHFGASFSIIEILTVIYNNCLKEDEKFILSKGHASMAYYYILSKFGYISMDEFENAYLDGQELMGHPVMNDEKNIYFSTGSLGLGISLGIGDALANKLKENSKNTYVLIGDGELEEGSIWESLLYAANKKLDNLIIILDNNKMQCDDFCKNILDIENKEEVFKNLGFEVKEINGHSVKELVKTFEELEQVKNRCKIVIANTIKGKGVSFMENNNEWHYRGINDEEYKKALKEVEEIKNEL